jgi:hypothetical protein
LKKFQARNGTSWTKKLGYVVPILDYEPFETGAIFGREIVSETVDVKRSKGGLGGKEFVDPGVIRGGVEIAAEVYESEGTSLEKVVWDTRNFGSHFQPMEVDHESKCMAKILISKIIFSQSAAREFEKSDVFCEGRIMDNGRKQLGRLGDIYVGERVSLLADNGYYGIEMRLGLVDEAGGGEAETKQGFAVGSEELDYPIPEFLRQVVDGCSRH